MHRYQSALMIPFVATSLGIAWAQQSSTPSADEFAAPLRYESLIRLDRSSPTIFEVNESAAADLVKADNQLAAQALQTIKNDMAALVTDYPNSPAAKEVASILDQADLKVIPGFGVYSKSVLCFTVPITR